jgi:acetyl esterase/lipase
MLISNCSSTVSATLTLALLLSTWCGAAQAEPASRVIPSRVVPVPVTVSPELQKLIANPPIWDPNKAPQTFDDWKALAAAPPDALQRLAALRENFGVTVTPDVLGGVPCYWVEPKVINRRNRNRLLVGIQGAGFFSGAGETGLWEAIAMAGLTGMKTIAIDYRLLPEHPFPAALDDVTSVWKQVIKVEKPANIAMFGSSSGGNLVLAFLYRAKRAGLRRPAAVMVGSPWSDISNIGDSLQTNAGIDNVAVASGAFDAALADLYANGRDPKNPLLSPVYGDFAGFPPTFLVSGTRDLSLSDTVRVHRKLMKARVPTQLVVEEALSHGQYLDAALVGAPEGRQLYSDIAWFFDQHLGR